jgi:ubiquinone/menaquinone biosynthesis C-methylase UbiE
MTVVTAPPPANLDCLDLLRCPESGEALVLEDGALVASRSGRRYRVTESGLPLFAAELCSDDGRIQQAHYDRVADAYTRNLEYPHTKAYATALDDALLAVLDPPHLGTLAEICCGRGESFDLFAGRYHRAVGVDVSGRMLEHALARARQRGGAPVRFAQGDATMLPLAGASFDTAVCLGGIHHVNDRARLFAEIARILRPGGRFVFREPLNDFFLWRGLRAIVYRLAPALDADTEHPLRRAATAAQLAEAGLEPRHWRGHGCIGFCVFMNSDVLVVNRLFRFVPGIGAIARGAAACDEALLRVPLLRNAGLQVVGVAIKPRDAT